MIAGDFLANQHKKIKITGMLFKTCVRLEEDVGIQRRSKKKNKKKSICLPCFKISDDFFFNFSTYQLVQLFPILIPIQIIRTDCAPTEKIKINPLLRDKNEKHIHVKQGDTGMDQHSLAKNSNSFEKETTRRIRRSTQMQCTKPIDPSVHEEKSKLGKKRSFESTDEENLKKKSKGKNPNDVNQNDVRADLNDSFEIDVPNENDVEDSDMVTRQEDNDNVNKQPRETTMKELLVSNEKRIEEDEEFTLVENKNWRRNKEERLNRPQSARVNRTQLISKIKTFFSGEGLLKYVGNESALLRELRRCKPNVFIRKALITKENMLLIITEDAKLTHEIRDKTWPKNAFMGGLTKTSITDMLYVGIKGVRKNLKLTEEEKNKLYEEYGIVSTVRIKGRDNKPTHTLKARIESKDDFQSILEEGVYINHFLHAVTPWENRIITCTNCQNFGHSNKDCFNRYRCSSTFFFFFISVDIDVINATAFSSLCTLPEATLAQLIELDEAEVTGLFSIESMQSRARQSQL
ncbi:hypothetical protein BpHYR1_016143 [Brachionus plicatilis]|uniref:Uncharacterized protein n=1 Tax=Brachionus plicatilis TaxID=10195 RepID=A0A3M7RPS2_BRAPC|nr:hypothetical protein BpHYR1_016143 [Brachionus plicatilis]